MAEAVTTEQPKRNRYTKARLAPVLMYRLKCCTRDEFRFWAEVADNSFARSDGLLRQFCANCDLSYQLQMANKGRCIRPAHFSEED